MSADATEALRLVNHSIRAFLARVQSQSGDPTLVTPEDLAALLAELSRAAEWVRTIVPSSAPDAELEKELSAYRGNVEQLEQILPTVEGRLLAEKACLEAERAHLAATAAWARASKKIL